MNKLLVGIVIGVLSGLLACAITVYLVIISGVIPARQDEAASDLERWAAHQSLRATIKREAPASVPTEATVDDENLLAGAKVYAGNCSGCHGGPQSKNPVFAAAYSPSAPLFANGDSVTDDPEGKIYWKIDHGIRFTGMPAFNKILSEKEMWQVTLFLKHLDKLPAKTAEYWAQIK